MKIKGTRLKVLGMILASSQARQPSLTIRQMTERLGFKSKNAVQQHINILVNEGLVSRTRHHARTLVPLVEFVPASRL